ncbi:MAG TPA: MarR family transcriptional regulator [Pseudonocardiaceae bacterium]
MVRAKADLAARLSSLLAALTVLLRAGGTTTSLSQARVLGSLRERGPQRVTELAARQLVAQPSMTTLINRMERQGLVTRRPDTSDRRAVRVGATRSGIALLSRTRVARERALRRELDGLEPDERAALVAALPVLERLIERIEGAARA